MNRRVLAVGAGKPGRIRPSTTSCSGRMRPLPGPVCAALLLAALASAQAAPVPVPPGAAALGYTKCIINERPTAADIAPGRTGHYKWFSGQWFERKTPPLDLYRTQDGMLVLSLGGDLTSMPLDFSQGVLPLLPGPDGFYVEFEVRLSSSDPDHWPAVWLMPAEHDGRHDCYKGDPPGYERFMEFDIDEGGFGPGLAGTVHSSDGIWTADKGFPHHIQNPNNIVDKPLDRSEVHTFGGSFDPVHQKVTWWVDGVEQMSAGAPYVPAVAAKQHFYMLISNQTHGKKKPYDMFVSAVRAFVPPSSKIPAVDDPGR